MIKKLAKEDFRPGMLVEFQYPGSTFPSLYSMRKVYVSSIDIKRDLFSGHDLDRDAIRNFKFSKAIGTMQSADEVKLLNLEVLPKKINLEAFLSLYREEGFALYELSSNSVLAVKGNKTKVAMTYRALRLETPNGDVNVSLDKDGRYVECTVATGRGIKVVKVNDPAHLVSLLQEIL